MDSRVTANTRCFFGKKVIIFFSPGTFSSLFQTDEHLTYFLTVLYSHPDFTVQDKHFEENGTVSGTVNGTVNAIQRKILEQIEKRRSISYEQLAERLKKGRTTIYRNIKKMVELNIIKRLGSDKNGYWEVNRGSAILVWIQEFWSDYTWL